MQQARVLIFNEIISAKETNINNQPISYTTDKIRKMNTNIVKVEKIKKSQDMPLGAESTIHYCSCLKHLIK